MAEMPLENKTAIVVGASRGFGRGVAESFLQAGATVAAVARNAAPLTELEAGNPRLHAVSADAADPVIAAKLMDLWRPDVLALVAGANPVLRPIQLQTWETFSGTWHSDVRMTFNWLREALLVPLRPGSRIIVMSSGAARSGSPLSGGYAGAKAAQRFMADYAAQESRRLDLGIGVTAVLPKLSPVTELGRPAAIAYAHREGLTEEEFLNRMGPSPTPQVAGSAFLRLATGPEGVAGAYLLTAEGLQPLPDPWADAGAASQLLAKT